MSKIRGRQAVLQTEMSRLVVEESKKHGREFADIYGIQECRWRIARNLGCIRFLRLDEPNWFCVHADHVLHCTAESNMISGQVLVCDNRDSPSSASKVLFTDVPLSFWGGVDPKSGVIIDTKHPLFDTDISDSIFCLPSGRGSCTASQVLLELILNGKAPRALILRDVDGIVCVGAIVAQEVFDVKCVPDILCLGAKKFNELLQQKPRYGRVLPNGKLAAGDSKEHVARMTSMNASADLDCKISLTKEEESMLSSVASEAERMSLQVMMRYAKLSSPHPTYLDIEKAHIDGCTYIGPGGLEFARKLVEANGRVKVPTTLNSVSADRRQWSALGVPPDYAKASIDLGDAYLDLGCDESFTCAPYLLPDAPTFSQNIIWGESNAVVYSNSVLGARTEKYADYLDICCAIVGKVPAAGVHLEENRRPEIVIDATEFLNHLLSPSIPPLPSSFETLFPTLGYVCGKLSDGRVPLLLGFQGERWPELVTTDHLKAFCAAFGTSGTSPIIHIAGITPEAQDPETVNLFVERCDIVEKVSMSQLLDTFRELNGAGGLLTAKEKVDLIALGNPHLSLPECENMWQLVEQSGKKHKEVRMIACISRQIQMQAQEKGYISKLEEFGVEFVNDTCWCMMLDPPVIPASSTAVVLTNSGKYAHYGPGLTNRVFRFGSTSDCFKTAVTGMYTPSISMPPWATAHTGADAFQKRHCYTSSAYAAVPECRGSTISQHNVKSLKLARLIRKILCKR